MTANPVAVSLRVHNRITSVGSLTGSGYTYSEQFQDTPRLVFLIDRHEPAEKDVYYVGTDEAYRVEALDPRDGVSITARCSRLTRTKAQEYAL